MIWDEVRGREAKKTTVEEVAFEHKLHLRVGVAIDLLNDEDLEHKDRVVGPASNLSWMKRGKDLLKAPPVNESGDLRKGILREPVVDEFFTDGKLDIVFSVHGIEPFVVFGHFNIKMGSF